MALFIKKTWKDRLTEFPGRRKLTDILTGVSTVFDVERAEGNELQNGDAFNKANMDDLEQRIEDAIGTGDIPEELGTDIISAITQLNSKITDEISVRYDFETHYIQIKNIDTWINYDYFNPDIQSLVPTMTSNTSPSGVASSNNERYGESYKAFDGDNNTNWMSDYQASNTGFHIDYKFQKPVTIVSFEVMVFNLQNVQNLNAKCILQVSRDGIVWENVHEFTTITTKELQTFENIKQIKDILYARIVANATFYYSAQNLKYSAGFSHIQYYGYKQI